MKRRSCGPAAFTFIWICVGALLLRPSPAAAQAPPVYVSFDFASAAGLFADEQKAELIEFVAPAAVQHCNTGHKPWSFKQETVREPQVARLVISMSHHEGLSIFLAVALENVSGKVLGGTHVEVVPPGPRPPRAEIIRMIKEIYLDALLRQFDAPMRQGLLAGVPVGRRGLPASDGRVTRVEDALALLAMNMERFKELWVEQFRIDGVCGDPSGQPKKFLARYSNTWEKRQVGNVTQDYCKVTITDYWDGSAWRPIDSNQLGCVNGFDIRMVYLLKLPEDIPPPAGLEQPPEMAP